MGPNQVNFFRISEKSTCLVTASAFEKALKDNPKQVGGVKLVEAYGHTAQPKGDLEVTLADVFKSGARRVTVMADGGCSFFVLTCDENGLWKG